MGQDPSQIREEIERIEGLGGAASQEALEYMKERLVASNAARVEAIERGDEIRVGVNAYQETEVSPLTAGNGHFVTAGQINGQTVQFIVDTGASFITLGMSDARRLSINYLGGQRVAMSTANGVVPAYRVKLDEVRVGTVTLNNVDGIVQPETSMPVVLLGMSFLNRMEMKRDGETMTLKKRF